MQIYSDKTVVLPRYLLPIITVVVISILLSCTVPPPKVSEISCQTVARHWIGEVAPNPEGVSTEILEISNLEESTRVTDEFKNSLECTGDAKFANQIWYRLVVGYFKDADGEYWYEIQVLNEIPEPTTAKIVESPTPTVALRPTATATPTLAPRATRTPTPDPFPSLECRDVSPLIIELAGQLEDPYVELLMVEKISHDDGRINCRGVVELQSGQQGAISFYQERYGEYGIEQLGLSNTPCSYLVSDIITLSLDRDPSILKIYDQEEIYRIDDRLDCIGLAKTSDGDYGITFHLEEDRDSDQFIGYEFSAVNTDRLLPTLTPQSGAAPAIPTPTPDPYVASSNGLRLLEWDAYENEYGTIYIRGIIENPSKTYRSSPSDACLFFDVYSSDGYFLKNISIAPYQSIPPTQKLRFDEYITDSPLHKLEFKAFQECH